MSMPSKKALMPLVLPAIAQVEESFTHDRSVKLFPEEEAVIAQAVEKRRKEFTAVRACAREAMMRAGAPVSPLVPSQGRAPRWPAGFVGSMTHCEGYCAATVGPRDQLLTVGIDAEPDESLPAGVLAAVSDSTERAWLADLPSQGPAWDRMLFSAKEAVFKAWYSQTQRWLDFSDGRLRIHDDGTFSVHLTGAGLTDQHFGWPKVEGRWAVIDRIIATAVALPAEQAAS